MLALLLAHNLAAASPIEMQITDPKVTEVILQCATGTYRAVPKDGRVVFENIPRQCEVSMIRRSGVIDRPGTWTCTLDSCSMQDVQHREVSDAPNRVNVIITSTPPPGAMLEITCNNGFRVRESVVTNTAIFEGIPDEECTLYFKGSFAPARFRPIRAGTWSCSLTGATALCERR